MENLIEGKLESGQTVVVVEDLVSTGQSSIKAVQALRESGAIVKGLVSIFDYGFDTARSVFEKEKCPFFSLSNYDILLERALANKYVSKTDEDLLRSWKNNPEAWGSSLKIA